MRSVKKWGLYVMAPLYMLAGFNHFYNPETYLKIMPGYLPLQEELNYATGALEAGFGALLLFKKTQNTGAWGLIVLLILIFPANVQMAYDYWQIGHPLEWMAYLRLPLQFLLIYFLLIYTRWYRQFRFRQTSRT